MLRVEAPLERLLREQRLLLQLAAPPEADAVRGVRAAFDALAVRGLALRALGEEDRVRLVELRVEVVHARRGVARADLLERAAALAEDEGRRGRVRLCLCGRLEVAADAAVVERVLNRATLRSR